MSHQHPAFFCIFFFWGGGRKVQYKWSLLKVGEGKYKGKHGGPDGNQKLKELFCILDFVSSGVISLLSE
jgi:hypothetical protein